MRLCAARGIALPSSSPKHEDELIVPARDGTLRVLRAACDAGVRRVVLTSSFAAIGYGHNAQRAPFNETTWTDINGDDVTPYVKSKTVAERAAWDFIAGEGGGLELSAVNPVGVFGPVLGPDFSSSISLVQRLMDGMPGCPRIYFGVVDVRDVADLHLRAMIHPAAKGERFVAVAGETMSMLGIAKVLRREMGTAKRVPIRQLPDWLMRLTSLRDSALAANHSPTRQNKERHNEKTKRLLGWVLRPNDKVIVATAESLIRLGIVKGGPG